MLALSYSCFLTGLFWVVFSRDCSCCLPAEVAADGEVAAEMVLAEGPAVEAAPVADFL